MKPSVTSRQRFRTSLYRRDFRASLAGGIRLLAAIAVAACIGTTAIGASLAAAAAAHDSARSEHPPAGARRVTRTSGTLADGATWIIDVPSGWNGTLLLFAHGLVPPGAPNPAMDAPDPVTAAFLLDSGFALAGSSFATTGWAVEDALRDQADLLDIFTGAVGRPETTIAWGASLGGLVATTLAERAPDRFDGALSLCGVLAGGVQGWNAFLDVMFAVKVLIAPDAPIELTNITDPFASIQAAIEALNAAQATPEGRARIALAAAVGNIPGWTRADQPEPDRHDFATMESNQFEVLRNLTVFLGLAVRSDVEARAGGNPSFNGGVDYSRLLRRSGGYREVLALYWKAGLSLTDDLRTLAAAPRIDADPSAVDYLTRFATFGGRLTVPVMTVHNIADPLAPVEHEQAYAAMVHAAGDRSRLRQSFVGRAGHCIFTPAESVAALQALITRVHTGRWGGRTGANALNRRALSLGRDLNAHLDDDTGQLVPTAPAFVPNWEF